ncbi:RNA polymerase sigma factor [Niabella hirudinis]|uniref:RNA polymerase sigma factor n=1 Tax=Niabella hirudinis TaxID=1285929 RepID=UPI003EBF5A74
MHNQQLYERVANGDEAAFRDFFSIYRERVYRFAFLVIKSHEVAEEITIDVFLKIWQKRAELRDINDMDDFLFIISKRKGLDYLKKMARDKKIQEILERELLEERGMNSGLSASLEQREIIEKLLSGLSPQRKNILMMSRVDGLSHKEISDQLNISQHTVKNTISQTIKILEPLRKKLWLDACWFVLGIKIFF